MPRVSVYIPDELLEQARKLEGSENTSRLVQRGLERLVEEQTAAPSYARTPDQGFERIGQLRKRLLGEARADYERGYATALEAASDMPLHVINALVNANFDLEKWLDPFKRRLSHELLEKSQPVTAKDLEQMMHESKETMSASPPAGDKTKVNDQWSWLWKTAEALGNVADPIGFDDFSFIPTKARQRGYSDAMRELWSALEKPDSSSSDSDETRAGGEEVGR